jgi:hypothetical protein
MHLVEVGEVLYARLNVKPARQGMRPDRESLEDVCTAAAIRELVTARVVSPHRVHGDTTSWRE